MSLQKHLLLAQGTAIFLLVASACLPASGGNGSGVNDSDGSGGANIILRPTNADSITSVQIEVTGSGIADPIVAHLARSGGEFSGVIANIPAGAARLFTGTAWQGVVQACEGTVLADIVAGETAQLVLTLDCDADDEGRGHAVINGSFNFPPRIDVAVANKSEVAKGGTVELYVQVSDPNPDDALSILWIATAGEFNNNEATTTTWTAPLASGAQTLTVTVSDPRGLQTALSVAIAVTSGADGDDSHGTPVTTLTLLPDTGQTTCYSSDTSITCPSAGQDFYGQDAEYITNPMSFTNNGNGTVSDNVTGLMWQREDDNVARTWANAISYCDDLTLNSYSDWRLPDEWELQSIVDYGVYDPTIDTIAFPNTNSSNYWSLSIYASNTANAWYVSFNDGLVYYSGKTSNNFVRCVR